MTNLTKEERSLFESYGLNPGSMITEDLNSEESSLFNEYGINPYKMQESVAPSDKSAWSFTLDDPTTGKTHINWLPRGFSQTLFQSAGNLSNLLGFEVTGDDLLKSSAEAFSYTPSEDFTWEDVKEQDIGAVETARRALGYGWESTPTALAYMFQAPAAFGIPLTASETERIAQTRADYQNIVDPTSDDYKKALLSAAVNVYLQRMAMRAPFAKSLTGKVATPSGRFGVGVAGETAQEFIQGGTEEYLSKIGTPAEAKMDVLDAALAEAVAVGPTAVGLGGVAAAAQALGDRAPTTTTTGEVEYDDVPPVDPRAARAQAGIDAAEAEAAAVAVGVVPPTDVPIIDPAVETPEVAIEEPVIDAPVVDEAVIDEEVPRRELGDADPISQPGFYNRFQDMISRIILGDKAPREEYQGLVSQVAISLNENPETFFENNKELALLSEGETDQSLIIAEDGTRLPVSEIVTSEGKPARSTRIDVVAALRRGNEIFDENFEKFIYEIQRYHQSYGTGRPPLKIVIDLGGGGMDAAAYYNSARHELVVNLSHLMSGIEGAPQKDLSSTAIHELVHMKVWTLFQDKALQVLQKSRDGETITPDMIDEETHSLVDNFGRKLVKPLRKEIKEFLNARWTDAKNDNENPARRIARSLNLKKDTDLFNSIANAKDTNEIFNILSKSMESGERLTHTGTEGIINLPVGIGYHIIHELLAYHGMTLDTLLDPGSVPTPKQKTFIQKILRLAKQILGQVLGDKQLTKEDVSDFINVMFLETAGAMDKGATEQTQLYRAAQEQAQPTPLRGESYDVKPPISRMVDKEDEKIDLSRRKFLKQTAGAAAGAIVDPTILAEPATAAAATVAKGVSLSAISTTYRFAVSVPVMDSSGETVEGEAILDIDYDRETNTMRVVELDEDAYPIVDTGEFKIPIENPDMRQVDDFAANIIKTGTNPMDPNMRLGFDPKAVYSVQPPIRDPHHEELADEDRVMNEQDLEVYTAADLDYLEGIGGEVSGVAPVNPIDTEAVPLSKRPGPRSVITPPRVTLEGEPVGPAERLMTDRPEDTLIAPRTDVASELQKVNDTMSVIQEAIEQISNMTIEDIQGKPVEGEVIPAKRKRIPGMAEEETMQDLRDALAGSEQRLERLEDVGRDEDVETIEEYEAEIEAYKKDIKDLKEEMKEVGATLPRKEGEGPISRQVVTKKAETLKTLHGEDFARFASKRDRFSLMFMTDAKSWLKFKEAIDKVSEFIDDYSIKSGERNNVEFDRLKKQLKLTDDKVKQIFTLLLDSVYIDRVFMEAVKADKVKDPNKFAEGMEVYLNYQNVADYFNWLNNRLPSHIVPLKGTPRGISKENVESFLNYLAPHNANNIRQKLTHRFRWTTADKVGKKIPMNKAEKELYDILFDQIEKREQKVVPYLVLMGKQSADTSIKESAKVRQENLRIARENSFKVIYSIYHAIATNSNVEKYTKSLSPEMHYIADYVFNINELADNIKDGTAVLTPKEARKIILGSKGTAQYTNLIKLTDKSKDMSSAMSAVFGKKRVFNSDHIVALKTKKALDIIPFMMPLFNRANGAINANIKWKDGIPQDSGGHIPWIAKTTFEIFYKQLKTKKIDNEFGFVEASFSSIIDDNLKPLLTINEIKNLLKTIKEKAESDPDGVLTIGLRDDGDIVSSRTTNKPMTNAEAYELLTSMSVEEAKKRQVLYASEDIESQIEEQINWYNTEGKAILESITNNKGEYKNTADRSALNVSEKRIPETKEYERQAGWHQNAVTSFASFMWSKPVETIRRYRYASPTMAKLADMIQRDISETKRVIKGGLDYIQRKGMALGQFRVALQAVLDNMTGRTGVMSKAVNDAVALYLVQGTPIKDPKVAKAAEEMKRILESIYTWSTELGSKTTKGFSLRPLDGGLLPRVWNIEELATTNGRKKFIKLLATIGIVDNLESKNEFERTAATDAYNIALNSGGFISGDFTTTAYNQKSKKRRKFQVELFEKIEKEISRAKLGTLLVNDIQAALPRFVDKAIEKTLYAELFGHYDEVLWDMKAEIEKEINAYNSREDTKRPVKSELAMQDINDMMDIIRHRYKMQSTWFNTRRYVQWFTNFTTVTLMPFVSLASMPEFFTPLMLGSKNPIGFVNDFRSVSWYSALRAMNGMSKLFRGKQLDAMLYPKGKAARRAMFLKALGIIDIKSQGEAAAMRYIGPSFIRTGIAAQGPGAKLGIKALYKLYGLGDVATGRFRARQVRSLMNMDTYFELVLLTSLTQMQQQMAANNLRRYTISLLKSISKGKGNTLQDMKILKDFGLTREEINEAVRWYKAGHKEFYDVPAEFKWDPSGMTLRFVDQVITRPNEATASKAFRHPGFAPLLIFKSFMTTFGNTFMVAMRDRVRFAEGEGTAKTYQQAKMAAGYLATMGAMYGMVMFAQSIRHMLQYEDDDDDYMDDVPEWKKFIALLNRTGLLTAPGSQLVDIFLPYKYGWWQKGGERAEDVILGPAYGQSKEILNLITDLANDGEVDLEKFLGRIAPITKYEMFRDVVGAPSYYEKD